MTTMFEPFFGVPQAIVRLGKLKSLSGVAVKLYMVLLHQSERHRTRRLRCATAVLEELTGCSRNALIKARVDLARAGFIRAERHEERGFILILCDPETGEPWPGDPKQRIRVPKKDDAFAPAAADVARATKPKVDCGIETAASKHPQTGNLSFRDDSAVVRRSSIGPDSPSTSWDAEERIDPTCETSSGGINFPFGYNTPSLNRPGSNPVMESLCGWFEN